ncbi:MAG TPA: alpha-glucan family phosphorylase, partial [Ardenticatenaceae bacterium]|nr:alpha-glucan family phosphorylase [Ardenticatenaceae bacterium]
LQEVYHLCQEPRVQGKLIFLADYDPHMARVLVQGVEVWLNNPRPPLEASGTSGMKAALNGVLNLSVLDGWWAEGYRPAGPRSPGNGWAIASPEHARPEVQDEADSQALYELLETQVVPAFYRRGHDGLPHDWIAMMKAAIRTIAPVFCCDRMLKEYLEVVYRQREA